MTKQSYNSVLVVLSGGQDSTTCLYLAKKLYRYIYAVTFDYGQRHIREIQAALKVASMAGVVEHEVLTLGNVLKGTSPLVSNARLEQYSGHDALPGGLEKTFVPMRNQLFLTLAANRAYVLGVDAIMTGVSMEDYGGYPDCRRPFIDALTEACNLGSFTGEEATRPPIHISTPLMHTTKCEEVLMALSLPGCYGALAWSHTSYDGQYPPRGRDHATLLRAKGFEEALVPDPLILRAHYEHHSFELPTTPNYEPDLVDQYMSVLRQEGGL